MLVAGAAIAGVPGAVVPCITFEPAWGQRGGSCVVGVCAVDARGFLMRLLQRAVATRLFRVPKETWSFKSKRHTTPTPQNRPGFRRARWAFRPGTKDRGKSARLGTESAFTEQRHCLSAQFLRNRT